MFNFLCPMPIVFVCSICNVSVHPTYSISFQMKIFVHFSHNDLVRQYVCNEFSHRPNSIESNRIESRIPEIALVSCAHPPSSKYHTDLQHFYRTLYLPFRSQAASGKNKSINYRIRFERFDHFVFDSPITITICKEE